MANATLVYFDKILDYDNTTRVFGATTSKGREPLLVKVFEDGIATINPTLGCEIKSFAEVIAGCFDEESNFA